MATTIKLKNGSGAPLAGDLVQGEPALDLTNKRLYTEDSGGSVIEVGTNPTSLTTGTFTSTGIDDNATSTAITIDASQNVGIGTVSPGALLEVNTNAENIVRIRSSDGAVAGILFGDQSDLSRGSVYYDNSNESMQFRVNNQLEAMRIDSSGHVGIGTSPSAVGSYKVLQIKGGSTANGGLIRLETSDGTSGVARFYAGSGSTVLESTTNTPLVFGTAGAERMRIDSSGNVGIGTASPVGGRVNISAADTGNAIASGAATLNITNSNETAFNRTSNLLFSTGTGVAANTIAGITGVYTGFSSNRAGALVFSTASTTAAIAERMRIDASGNVGIGTSSPSTKLHVSGTSGTQALFERTGSTGAYIGLNDSSGNFVYLGDNNGTFEVQTSGSSYSTKMAITPSGNVGIGNTAVNAKLEVAASSGEVFRADASGGAYRIVANQSGVNFNGNVGIGTGSPTAFGGYLTVHQKNLSGDAIHLIESDGGIIAQTIANDGSAAVTTGSRSNHAWRVTTNDSERMRLDTSGNLLVGTTSSSPTTKVNITQPANAIGAYIFASGATFTSSVLSVQGNLSSTNGSYVIADFLNGAGTGRCKIYDSGNIQNTNNSYGALSDAKLKTEIVDAGSQWNDIKALRFRKYKMISDPEQKVQMGVIAQEAEEAGMSGLVEETVDRDLNGNDLGSTTKSIKYSVLYLKAVKALQEAIDRIETLEAEVAALKGA